MPLLSMENPVFAAYAVAAALMILKLMAQGWGWIHVSSATPRLAANASIGVR